jgi:hypothetical protein
MAVIGHDVDMMGRNMAVMGRDIAVTGDQALDMREEGGEAVCGRVCLYGCVRARLCARRGGVRAVIGGEE